jgi:hypothetical protein
MPLGRTVVERSKGPSRSAKLCINLPLPLLVKVGLKRGEARRIASVCLNEFVRYQPEVRRMLEGKTYGEVAQLETTAHESAANGGQARIKKAEGWRL